MDRSTPAWARTMALLVPLVLTLVVPLYHGVFRSYIANPDPDIVFAYQALSLNDHDSRINAEHTGYIYFALLATVLRGLHALGFLAMDRISQLEHLDGAAFEAGFASIIFAGRGLSIILVLAFVALIYVGTRHLTRSTAAAAVAALLTAASLGTAAQALLLRTELLSMLFVMAAFFSLVVAAQRDDARNAAWLALAGLTAALALATKLQTLFSLFALPVLAIAFGRHPPAYAGYRTPAERAGVAALLAFGAAAAALPVAVMLIAGMIVHESSGAYQALIVLYLALSVAVYVIVHGVSALRTSWGIAALILGFSAGILAHLLYPNPAATDAIGAFVEHMKPYAGLQAGTPYKAIVDALGMALLGAVRRRTVGDLLGDPMRIIEMATIVGAVIRWISGAQRTAALALLLCATSFGIETFCRFRGLEYHYYVYVDPWLAVAAGLVLTANAGEPEQAGRKLMARIGLAIAAVISVLHLPPALGEGFPRRQLPENACYQAQTYMPRLASQFGKYCP